MKSLLFSLLTLLIISTSCQDPAATSSIQDTKSVPEREFYQLKTYTFDSDQQLAMTSVYLKDAFLPAMKKMGIGPIGVFRNRLDDKDSLRKILVLIPFDDLDQFRTLESKLTDDPAYLQAGNTFLNAPHDQPCYSRISSTLMQAFEDMPVMQASSVTGPRTERIYELRSYESSSEAYYRKKVDMFNAGGEIKLFDRLDFHAVFYAEVLSGPSMPNLMYMTSFTDLATRDSLWKAFFASPEWTKLKAMEIYKNTVSHADIFLLYPTDYSDY